jgi:hypothetical protein
MKESTDKNTELDGGNTSGPVLLPWAVCPALVVLEVNADNKSYRFFAEDLDSGKPAIMNALSLEFFNHELLRVDTTSEVSLLRFSQKWGLILAPFYASKTHSLAMRSGGRYDYQQSYTHGIEALRLRLTDDVIAFKGSYGFNKPEKTVDLLVGSEFAREAVLRGDYGERRLGAVVSVDEVAYTVRLLQLATTMQAAYDSSLRGNELSNYLLDNRIIPRRHPYELEENDGMDLFFSNILTVANRAEIVRLSGGTGDGKHSAGDNGWRRTRQQAIDNLALEVGIENCRSFTRRAALNLAAENIGLAAGLRCKAEGSIVEAVLTNFEYVMTSKFEWITCEWCGRVFKYQKEYDPSNRYRKSMFCRNSCRVMNAQSSKRKIAEAGR